MRLVKSKQDLRDLVQDLGELLEVPYILLTRGALTIPNKHESLLASIKIGEHPKMETFGYYNLDRDEQLVLRNTLHNVRLDEALKDLTIKVDYLPEATVNNNRSNRTLNTETIRELFDELSKSNKVLDYEYVVLNGEVVSHRLSLVRGTQIKLYYGTDSHIWFQIGHGGKYNFVPQYRDGYYPETSPTVLAQGIREVAVRYIEEEQTL